MTAAMMRQRKGDHRKQVISAPYDCIARRCGIPSDCKWVLGLASKHEKGQFRSKLQLYHVQKLSD